MFNVNDYDYELPDELIATTPEKNRDQSRLMVIDRASGQISHHHFHELPSLLSPDTALVANNTQVLKARLKGNRILHDGTKGGKVEFLMLEKKGLLRWEGIAHSAAKQNPGLTFSFHSPEGLEVRAVIVRGTRESTTGTIEVEFDRDPVASGIGEIPLPHYMNRAPEMLDESTYQTVYAKNLGSAAAPTAGLHFTPALIESLLAQGMSWSEVTLHVGLGTFRPIQASDVREHKMHEEAFWIEPEVASRLNSARSSKKKILAVGTTSVRTLESASALTDGGQSYLTAGPGRTSIFIYPGYKFKFVDQMITNFHLPKSTLLLLVSAFAGAGESGRNLIMRAYHEAIKERYRFYSYGDAMWIK